MIPFRESLEAMLIISLLLSVVKQGDSKAAKRWIIGGSALGGITSLAIGVLVYYVLSVVAFGTNSQLINGYSGVFSSVMLVFVGIWMHKSSDVQKMTAFYKEKSQSTSSSGVFGLAALAFLAVIREGLEIVIFIIGLVGKVSIQQLIGGFLQGGKDETPRNLFGFKDGTANVEHETTSGYDEVVWAGPDEPTWFQEGTYLGYRKIKMLLEIWDRSSLLDQEDTFGRKKESGAAYGRQEEFEPVILSKQPIDSHVKLAKDVKKKMHRRAYSYQNGIDEITGTIEAGLLFIAFTQNPEEQYIPMLQLMGRKDKLNEYTIPIGNGLYACQKGLKNGEYFGQRLFA